MDLLDFVTIVILLLERCWPSKKITLQYIFHLLLPQLKYLNDFNLKMSKIKFGLFSSTKLGVKMRDFSSYKILILTDTHFLPAKDDQFKGWKVYDHFIKVYQHALEHDSYDAILLTGDLANNGDIRGYRLLHAELQKSGVPLYVVPGNHDIPQIMSEVFPMPRKTWSPLENWAFIFLDSTKGEGKIEGRLSENELHRLKISLENSFEQHTVIVLHHHSIPTQNPWIDQWILENAQEFLNLIEISQAQRRLSKAQGLNARPIELVLFGHTHSDFECQTGPSKVTHLCTPSPWIQFCLPPKTGEADDRPGGYRVLEIWEDGQWSSKVIRVA